MKKIAGILFMILTLAACKKAKNETTGSADLAPVTVEFDNVADGMDLILDDQQYTNALGENYTVTTLMYFVSNFSFTREDGTIYTVPRDSSFFLIKEHDENYRFARLMVPEGNYTRVSFILGIDSLTNTLDVDHRPGILNPGSVENEGMYWGWNSGYIFFKMEGQALEAEDGVFKYHIGGFGGYSSPTINNIRTITLDLKERGIAKVRKNSRANIHLLVDIAKVFTGVHPISFTSFGTIMFNDKSTQLADNYQYMFSHDHTEN